MEHTENPPYRFWHQGIVNNDIDKHPGVYTAVQDFLQTEEGRQLKVGPVKKRYSRTVADSYLSHGCYYCDAIFGDFHLIEEKLYAFWSLYYY